MAIVTRRTRFALDFDGLARADAPRERHADAGSPAARENESDERERRWRDRFAFPPLASFPSRFIR